MLYRPEIFSQPDVHSVRLEMRRAPWSCRGRCGRLKIATKLSGVIQVPKAPIFPEITTTRIKNLPRQPVESPMAPARAAFSLQS
jgi:hypothetical protein